MTEVGRVDMRIEGARRFRDLSRDLKEAGRKDLDRKLRRELRKAGRPAVEDVQRAVKATPVKGTRGGGKRERGGRGLRAAIAAATQVSTSTSSTNPSVRIRVAASRFRSASSPATLPKYFDGELSRFKDWAHPVFGDRTTWVHHQPSHAYFYVTLHRHEDDFRRGIEAAMDDVAAELGQG